MENRSKTLIVASQDNQKKEKTLKKLENCSACRKNYFYVLLFALTLGGCVQTMIVKKLWIYWGWYWILWFISKQKYHLLLEHLNNQQHPLKKQTRLTTRRILLNTLFSWINHLSHKEYSKTIQELRNQTESDGAKYGEWHEFLSFIKFNI